MTPEQLALPLRDVAPATDARSIPRPDRVWVNRSLRMSGIDWIGFDMDYTLARYEQREMDALSIRATVAKLVARGYPAWVRDLEVDPDFAIRGLLIDKRTGNVLKMDRYKVAQIGYHGLRQLSREELGTLYQQRKLRPATPRFHWVDTLYALSEASVFAAIVHASVARGEVMDWPRLFTDIRESIDEAHRDGTILDTVLADLPRFVARDPDLGPSLHKLRSAGKKLFLLTNSRWAYTDAMMTYLLGDALAEYPSWRQYFELVVVAAQKPAFFQQRNAFAERDGETTKPALLQTHRGKVFEGGNLHDLEQMLGVTGDRVLYVGDHIYGDILRSKKESAWRTVLVVQDLAAEVLADEACADEIRHGDHLAEQIVALEETLRFYQAQHRELSRHIEGAGKHHDGTPVEDLDAERTRVKRTIDRIRARIRAADAEMTEVEARVRARFHPYWGSLMKEGLEMSSFGAQVEEYACLYTAKVSNFLSYSPQQHFRSPRETMPHEL